MSNRKRSPGSALQRTTGAEEEIQTDWNFQGEIYPTSSNLQIRHIRHRFGVSGRVARLVAALHFGEGGR
jgi:hypothetical protein